MKQQVLGKGLQYLDALCLRIAMACLLLMLACVLIQIVARYGFDAPPAWTEELARYAMIWAALLGATCAYYRHADPALARKKNDSALARLLELLCVACFTLPVIYHSPAAVLRLLPRETETMAISSALVFSIVPISFSIIFIYALAAVFSGGTKAANDNEAE